MDQIQQKTSDDPMKAFKKAVENVKPVLEVKTRRVGGANYQVPVEVNPFRRQSLAIRWLLQYARSRSGKGVEIWDIRDGRLSRWEAAFNPVAVGDDPVAALGII